MESRIIYIEKKREIEHQNQILLNRMLAIDLKPTQFRKNIAKPRSKSFKTLNQPCKNREIEQINKENKVIYYYSKFCPGLLV